MKSLMNMYALPIIGGFLLAAIVQLSHGQLVISSPAPQPPQSSDSAAIDQGVAYVLLIVALAVTYLVH